MTGAIHPNVAIYPYCHPGSSTIVGRHAPPIGWWRGLSAIDSGRLTPARRLRIAVEWRRLAAADVHAFLFVGRAFFVGRALSPSSLGLNASPMTYPASLTNRMLFLGTGTSHGVPVVGCRCEVCRSPNPKNQRTRCSVVFGLPEGNLLIDTGAELRIQLLREGIDRIHAVAYTHGHADHLFGLDDLRILADYLGHDLPVYCARSVEERIRKVFDYAFDPVARAYPAGGVPHLAIHPIVEEPFDVLGATVTPIPLHHGRYHVLGFRIGDVAYCTDVNSIPPSSEERLQGLDVLVLDCLRRRPHATHFSLDEAVAVAKRLAARRTLFTHICHDLEHEATNAALPSGMALAYDGLMIDLKSE